MKVRKKEGKKDRRKEMSGEWKKGKKEREKKGGRKEIPEENCMEGEIQCENVMKEVCLEARQGGRIGERERDGGRNGRRTWRT